MKAANATPRWALATGLYVLGGTASSVFVGSLLGAVGAALLPSGVVLATPVLLGIALVAVLRDTEFVRLPILEACRQTRARFGTPIDSLLWGLDIGLFFTTHLNLLAVWLLPLAVVLSAQPLPATVLFLAYWLGRAAPTVVVGPLLLRSASGTVQLLVTLGAHRKSLLAVHAAAIATVALLIVLH